MTFSKLFAKIKKTTARTWGHWSFPQRWAICVGLIFVVLSAASYRYLIPRPQVIAPTGPSLGTTPVSNTKPVKIVFSHPIKQSKLGYAIYPPLKGTWDLQTDLRSARSTLTFTPTESPTLETRYTIELRNIQSILFGRSENYLLSFQTDSLPTYQSISPANLAVDVLPNAPVVVTFDKPVSDSVEITVATTPEMVFGKPTIAGPTVTFPHTELFQKGAPYELRVSLSTVKRDYLKKTTTVNTEKTQIVATTFTTITAPSIHTYTPTGAAVDPATPIRLEFKQAMDKPSSEAAFSLSPTAAGAFSWENDQTMIFTPTAPLTKGQSYTVTIANTATATSGFSADEPLTWSFTTIGAVTVSSFSPVNGKTGVDVDTSISATFNQEVDHASAESKFTIDPAVVGTFSWNGNTMTFKPGSALVYSQAYTATIAPGVKTVKGLDSTSAASTKFTTRTQSVMLSVPAYQQAHVYSCMIAAARSALAFRGVKVSESNIISKVGIDSTKWSGTWGGSDGIWGDPDADIVGPLDNAAATSPSGKKTTNVYWGYGSHWTPIANALSSYGISNEVKTGMTVSQLAQSISDGNPVIIWWVNGIWPSYSVDWKTPSGKSVRAVNGMHVQVVRGFTGTVENPLTFTVTDSGYNYPGRSFDIGTFKAKWAWFNNTGIIVK